jgi:hypothetical protein
MIIASLTARGTEPPGKEWHDGRWAIKIKRSTRTWRWFRAITQKLSKQAGCR